MAIRLTQGVAKYAQSEEVHDLRQQLVTERSRLQQLEESLLEHPEEAASLSGAVQTMLRKQKKLLGSVVRTLDDAEQDVKAEADNVWTCNEYHLLDFQRVGSCAYCTRRDQIACRRLYNATATRYRPGKDSVVRL